MSLAKTTVAHLNLSKGQLQLLSAFVSMHQRRVVPPFQPSPQISDSFNFKPYRLLAHQGKWLQLSHSLSQFPKITLVHIKPSLNLYCFTMCHTMCLTPIPRAISEYGNVTLCKSSLTDLGSIVRDICG